MPRPVQVRRQLGAGDYVIEPPRSAVMVVVVPAIGDEAEGGADHAGGYYYIICGTGKARAQSQQQRRSSSTTASVPDLFGWGSDGFGFGSSSSCSRRGAASVPAAGPRSRPHLVAREEAVHVIQ